MTEEEQEELAQAKQINQELDQAEKIVQEIRESQTEALPEPPKPRKNGKTPAVSLAKSLLAAQREVRPLAKDGINQFHNFRYTTAESLFTAARDILLPHGLVVGRGSWEILEFRDFMAIRQEITLEHSETGEIRTYLIDFPFQVEKGKPWDKALASSLTVALSYWLRDLLLIPRQEEGMNARDDRQFTPPEPQIRANPLLDIPANQRMHDAPPPNPNQGVPQRKSIFNKPGSQGGMRRG